MKKFKTLALTLVLSIGIGATAYAATTIPQTTPDKSICQGIGLGRVSGKTTYEIAKQKGLTDEQFKAIMLEEKTKAIDEKIKDGTITKEQGEAMKSRITTNLSNCTTPGTHSGKNTMKNGKGNCNGTGECAGLNRTGK